MTEEIKVIPTNGTSADDVKYAKRVEKIYIDGVNVAGCSLYLKDNGKCLRLLTDNEPETECNAICEYGCLYHKEQLKRLEQENKALKDIIDDGRAENKRFREENEELKKQIESDKGLITVGGKQQYEYLQRIDELKKTVENQKLEYEELQCDLSEVENACGCYQSENAELKQENKELKEKIQFHNKENSNLLAERNALQIGYDEIREVRERYRLVLEEIKVIADDTFKVCDDDCGNARKIKLIIDKINEILNKG